ncbi:hypothetical protein [Thermoactinomyces sp. CICC 10523]|uniref:hypothetical protein n=1 Tax=Thermoactinomyces sp. CICC 10523 TaxID=2767428 RepID=UPI0018DB3FBC|nr:hypothetical protein [Thermoactinomyces sp. CICC 10523]MBH8597322.1 hypothetical protein [Thermoactinomyces sp. CICC 10523]
MEMLKKQNVIIIMSVLNILSGLMLLGSSVFVLFGDDIFKESVAEASKAYATFFWVALFYTIVTLYYSLPKQIKVYTNVCGWIFTVLGLFCIGVAVHDWSNGLANGDDPLTVLFIPGFIFIFIGLLCLIFRIDLKESKSG